MNEPSTIAAKLKFAALARGLGFCTQQQLQRPCASQRRIFLPQNAQRARESANGGRGNSAAARMHNTHTRVCGGGSASLAGHARTSNTVETFGKSPKCNTFRCNSIAKADEP